MKKWCLPLFFMVLVIAFNLQLSTFNCLYAAALTNVNNSLSSNNAGDTPVYDTATFTTASSDTISRVTIKFPSGFNLTAASMASVQIGSISSGSISISGDTIVFDATTPDSVSSGTGCTISFGNIGNNQKASTTYTVSVATYNQSLAIIDGPTSSSNFTINPLSVSETVSFFKFNAGKILSDGLNPCTLTFYIKDKYGNALSGKQVTISTIRGTPTDTIAQPSLTDSNGQCKGTIVSSNLGEDTFTAVCDGATITLNLISNPSAEEGTTSPTSWALNPNAATATLTRDTTTFVTGGVSAKINVTAVPSATSVMIYQQNVLIDRGIKYRVSFYSRASKIKTGCSVSVSQWTTFTSCGLSQSFTMYTTWADTSFTFTATGSFVGDNITNGYLQIATSHSINETMTWWVDDVRFVRVPTANFTASKLTITSPQRTVGAGMSSDSITVEARDGTGAKDTAFNNTLTLTSSSSGKFSLSSTTWADTTIIRFSAGYCVFYYRDTTIGSPTITVSSPYPSPGLKSDTQIVSVTQPTVSETFSYLKVNTPKISADGITPCTVTTTIKDANGNAIIGRQVTIVTTRGIIIDTITQPGLTDNNGQCTGTIISSTQGQDTVTAVCEGTTITENIVDNPSFEEGTANPSNWSYNSATSTWTWVSDVKYSGNKAIKNVCPTTAGDNCAWTNTKYSITPSTAYNFTQYTKTDSFSGSADIRIIWYDGVTVRGDVSAASLSGNFDWTLLNGTLTSPSNAYQMQYRCNSNGVGTAWFDCVRAKRIPTIEFIGATKLVIITSQRTISAGSASESIYIQAQYTSGLKDSSYNGTCTFTSSSYQGRFTSDPNSSVWSSTLTVNLVSGETYVYYKDTRASTSMITVSAAGLTSATQIETTTTGAFSETVSFLMIPKTVPGDGITPCTAVVFVSDYYRNPISGQTVIITTSRKGTADDGYDTITQPTSVSDTNGMCTGSLVSSLTGKDTITAYISGDSSRRIENTIFSDVACGVWNFEDNTGTLVRDISSNGNKGYLNSVSLAGDTLGWVAGKSGHCLALNGSNNYVSVADANSLDPSSEITVEIWCKPTTTQSDRWLINKIQSGADGYRFGNFVSNYINWQIPVTSYSHNLSSTDTLSLNQWAHVVGTYDGSNLRIYINGVEKGILSRTGNINPSSGSLYIGAYNGSVNEFIGYIDELRIYNKALTADEVKASYQGTAKPVTFLSASKLAVVTPARIISAGSVSESIVIQAQWTDGSKATGYNETCFVSSSSGFGAFSASPSGSWTSTLTLQMVQGETYVYYKDTKVGSPTITVTSGSLANTTQIQSVIAGTFSETTSYIMLGARNSIADGTTPCTIVVVAADGYRNPISGQTVIITTSRKGTAYDLYDTITYPYGQTSDANGFCTGVFVSSLSGNDTITAYLSSNSAKLIQNTIFADILAGGWNFEESANTTAYDISSYRNNGTLISSPSWTYGYYGLGLQFDGSTNYVTVPDTDSLDPVNAITIEFWAKILGGTGNLDAVRKNNGYMIRRDSIAEGQDYSFFVVIGTGWEPRVGNIIPDSGPNATWYHVVGTYDKDGGSNNLKIYINGNLNMQTARTGAIDTATGALNIGGGGFNGIIDEVKIYNKALTADEVKVSYLGKPKPITLGGVVSQLGITTPERTVAAGAVSDLITVEAQDNIGQKITTFNNTVTLQSSSISGRFSADQVNWSALNDSSVTLSSGSANFYYKDTTVNSAVITVSRTGLTPDTQIVNVTASSPVSETTSYLRLIPSCTGVISINSQCYVTIVIKDDLGNPLPGKQVTVVTSRGPSVDTITQPALTDSNGQCTAIITSSTIGQDTITAVCEGATITENIINNPSFENGTSSPSSWNFGWTWSSSESKSGNRSILINPTSSGDYFAEARWTGTPYVDRWPISPNTKFYATQYTKCDSLALGAGTGAYIRVILWKDTGVLTEVGSSSLSGTQPWTLQSTTFTSLSTANGLMFRCQNRGVGSAWYDCVRVKRVPTIEFVFVGPATELVMITPERTTPVGVASDSIAIEVRDVIGQKVSTFNETITLSSSSSTGQFSLDKVSWSTSNDSSITFTAGSGTFYYRDTTINTPVITVSRAGLTADTQTINITASTLAFSETTSYILIPSGCAGDGVSQCVVKVVVMDTQYNPILGKTVLITTSRKGTAEDGYDTITQPAQTTDVNGQCTGYIVSSLPGKDTITATVVGESGKVVTFTFLNTAPVARWDFDENAGSIAYSLNSLNGSVFGASRIAGKFGSALAFDSSTDYVQVADNELLDPKSQITVEMWARTDNGNQGDKYLMNKVSSGSEAYRIGGVSSGSKVWWSVPISSFSPSVTSSNTVPLGEWFHLVTTYDGSYMRIYINGVASGSASRTGDINNSPSPLYIGSYNAGGGAYFTGDIDDVRIYHKALSAEEITASYLGRQKPLTWTSAAKIAFITPSRTFSAGTVSESIVVQAQWADGSKAVGYNENCQFSSSSSNGLFSVASAGETWTSTITVKMVTGETYVYYKDITGGSPTITVKSGVLPDTTQVQSVLPGAFSNTSSYLWISPSSIPADGNSVCTVSVFVRDSFGGPIPDKTVTISTNRSSDTISQPAMTDSNGMCTGTLRSSTVGDVTITAYYEGSGITTSIHKDICIGMWPLDEGYGTSTKDFSPSGSNGTLAGSPLPTWVDGKYGKALQFNGVTPGNYVNGSYPSSMRIHLDNKFSYLAWVKVDSTSSYGTIWRGGGGGPGWEITGGGAIRLLCYTGSGQYPNLITYTYSTAADSWVHIAVVGDGTNYHIYVNGEKKNSASVVTLADDGNNYWRIGGRGDAWNLKGVVDEVMLIDKALTDTEVNTLYASRTLPIRFTSVRLRILSEPFKIKSGDITPVTIAASDPFDNVDVYSNDSVTLSTSSESGSFSSITNSWTNINYVTLTNGTATVYYKDYRSGYPTITVSRSGFTSDVQNETITASRLQFTSNSFELSCGQISETITVVVQDELANTDTNWNETVALATSSSAGRFSVSNSPWSDTSVIRFNSGIVKFFYRDKRGGNSVITVTSQCDGTTVTQNLLSNPSMENGTGSPSNWTLSPNAASATATKDGTTSANGSYSAKIDITAVPSATNVYFYQRDIPISRGTNYKVSFYAKCSKSKSAGVNLAQWGTWQNCGLNQSYSMGTSWAYYSYTFTASGGFTGDNINDAYLQFGTSHSIDETMAYWVDNVKLVSIPNVKITLSGQQSQTIIMPMIQIQKYQRNERLSSESTSLPVAAISGDTVEWTIIIGNSGTETATGILITDTAPFDTSIYASLDFVSIDTSTIDSWTYTINPAGSVWQSWNSSPSSTDNVKGLRWRINTLGINEQKNIKFRMRVK